MMTLEKMQNANLSGSVLPFFPFLREKAPFFA